MNYFLRIALFVFALSPVLSAETARENKSQQLETVAIPGENSPSNVFVSAGAGLAMFQGAAGPSVNLGALTGIGNNRNLFGGLDAGLNFWSFGSTSAPLAQVSTQATGVQLLPTFLYRFEIAGPTFFPYIGASLGPNIYFENQTITDGAGTRTDTATNVFLEGLIRPGFFTSLGRTVSLQVEAKFGVLRSGFIFLPQANAVFAI